MSRKPFEPVRYLVDVSFSNGMACCGNCALFQKHSRHTCGRTGEYITDDSYPGYHCPLRLINDEQYLNYLREGGSINETV